MRKSTAIDRLYVDVGGTTTRIWNKKFKKTFPTDLSKLPALLKRYTPPLLIIGLRGVWTSIEKAAWKKKLCGTAKEIRVLSDIELAHELAFGDKPGIVLNAGTGSIAFGRNSKGKTARAGGLGPLVGDEGSGFWIGKEYLRRIHQRDNYLNGLRAYITGPDAVAKIASLAKTVLKKAERDTNSLEAQILREAARHLRKLVEQVETALKEKDLPVKLAGGLFNNRSRTSRFRF